MKILTYLTEKTKKTAQQHGRISGLESVLRKIVEDQSPFSLEAFNKNFFKKDMGRDFRVMFSRHQIDGYDDYQILCAYEFFSRGDKDYDSHWQKIKLTDAPDLHAEIAFQHKEKFLKIIETDIQILNEKLPQLPELSKDEHLWLLPPTSSANQNMVLETEAWIDKNQQEKIIRSSDNLYELLHSEIYSEIDAFDEKNTSIPYEKCGYKDKASFRVHFQYFPAHHILMLLDITSQDVTTPTSLIPIAHADRETLIRHARRAYPLDVFILEQEEFFQIQQQTEGNFALSPEESAILAGIYQQAGNRFPLFINGRAGSGKSTLLHYLLKDYLYLCFEHWNPEKQFVPLYLTYSKNLHDAAVSHVQKLLDANAEILTRRNPTWEVCYKQNKNIVFQKTFNLFRNFLIALLPEDVQKRFSIEKRIGYAQFKRLWEKTFGRHQDRKRYSVDLVWHIIRSYIKGMANGINDYLTPEKYALLSNGQRTVTMEDYAAVFQRFWESWYKSHCEKNDVWDDQDLALMVLVDGQFPNGYPAIFCDEAQDFTAIELKIIYRLSLFSKRNVLTHDIGNIPFVFAGDPLQTLNPTGFRWEAVKSNFHDYLLGPLENDTRNGKGILNYHELSANYRSTKKIVQFCNYLQLIRLCLFGNEDQIRPQEAWFPDHQAVEPFLYATNAPDTRRLLSSNAVVIIPNCHEDEEIAYVRGDALLCEAVERDESDTPNSVLSPNRAKGLEYNEVVVLYKFGATCPKTLAERLKGDNSKNDVLPNTAIEWEYFFNRLYVAASRARRRLIIVDDPDTFETFWKPMQTMDAEHLIRHLGGHANPLEWDGSRILIIHQGNTQDLEQLMLDHHTYDDTRELADKFFRQGLDAEDPGLLRRARTKFESLQQKEKADECYGHALRLEGNYKKAAERFLAIQQHSLALSCFWADADFNSIKKTHWTENEKGDLRVELSGYLVQNRDKEGFTWNGDTEQTKKVLRRLETIITEYDVNFFRGRGGRDAANVLLTWLSRTPDNDNCFRSDWKTIEQLARRFNYSDDQLAIIAYVLNHYEDACYLWEMSNKIGHEKYCRSLCKIQHWPETIEPLHKLNEFKLLLRDWRTHQENLDSLSQAQKAMLMDALIETDQLDHAVKLLTHQRVITDAGLLKPRIQRLWRQIDQLSAEHVADIGRLYLGVLLENRNNWGELITVLRRLDMLSLPEQIQQVMENDFVERVATHLTVREAPGTAREVLSQLLHERLRREGDRWLPVIEKCLSLPAVGAAIESANRMNDALEYYEWAVRLPGLTTAQRDYFDERFAACLQQHIIWKHEQEKDVSGDEKRLADLRRKLGERFINSEPDITSYPGESVLPRDVTLERLQARRHSRVTQEERDAEEALSACDPRQDYDKWQTALVALATTLANHDRWTRLAQEYCSRDAFKQRFPSLKRSQLDEGRLALLKAIIEPLSSSMVVLDAPSKHLQALTELLVSQLRDNDSNTRWSGCDQFEIDRDVIGAALERLGHDVTTIQFYEWALKEANTKKSRREMAKRLIVSRERYAEYLAKSSDQRKSERAIEQRQQAEQLRKKYDLVNSDLPEYPILD
ncbi:hypothetical protein HUU62_15465 [Rhodoferax sp. 4810]|uniref:DNA 3'-5' helicase II n=1 Tax=Thiospirillum jenense TaxID=1653858 RepID=A0A839HFP0_9GAMM|nr:hypothetical protein [Thiospirillum jenense]MBB1075806.1 hypothetical protein [Rhodoferax jenense]MBB1126880.1 hypothetical protein [Thiospirillum jenense]